MAHLPTIRLKSDVAVLPDNKLWENRFEIHSESSSRVYIVAQNIEKRFWGCSCPSWRVRRQCKHLRAIGLPENERPYEVKLEK